MFWNLDWNNGSQINTLLEKEDVENIELLREIMEEEDLLQELRTDNQLLVKFLVKDEVLGELVKMIVNEPGEELEDSIKYKQASIACELLIADINQSEQLSDLLVDPNSSSLHSQNQSALGNTYFGSEDFDSGAPAISSSEPHFTEGDDAGMTGSSPPSPSPLPQIITENTHAGDSSALPLQMHPPMATNYAGDSVDSDPAVVPPPGPDDHISTLFDFLKTKEINPLLASYFSRTVAELLQRKPDKIWPYIRDKQGTEFLNNLLRHINTSAIWDVLMRLMTCKEGSLKTEIVTWLSTQGLITSLIENLKPERGSLRNQAASLALSDIVRLSRARSEFGFGNPLLDELERPETTTAILNTIIEANTQALKSDDSEAFDSTILACVNVLLTFLEPAPSAAIPPGGAINQLMANNTPDYLSEYTLSDEQERQVQNRYQNVIDNTLRTLSSHIGDLCAVLMRDPSRQFARPSSNMPSVQYKSLGATRLNVCKLFTEILKHKNEVMNTIFVEKGVLKIMVDLFFEYCFNNFLHALVTTCIQHIMQPPIKEPAKEEDHSNWWDDNGEDSKDSSAAVPPPQQTVRKDMQLLIKNLLVDCQLIHRIHAAFQYEKARNPTEANVTRASLPTGMPAHPNVSVTPPGRPVNEPGDPEEKVPVRLRPPRLPYMGHLIKIATYIAQLEDPNAPQPGTLPMPTTGLGMARSTMATPWNGLKSYQSTPQNLSKAGKTSVLTPFIEKILGEAFTEEFLVSWRVLVERDLADILERNSRRLGGVLPSERFQSFMGAYPNSSKNNFYNNYSCGNAGGDDDEEEEDEVQEKDTGTGSVSTNAQDLYSSYSKTGLMTTQDTPADSIAKANMFEDGDLTKGDKLGDYNKVGDYDLSLNDNNEEERQNEYKQSHDREQYTKIVRSRIPAIDEKYKDSPELEQKEIDEYKKEYDMGSPKGADQVSDESWEVDDDCETTDEKDTDEGSGEDGESSSGEEGESSDDEQVPSTFPEPKTADAASETVDTDLDPWAGEETSNTQDKNRSDDEFEVGNWESTPKADSSGKLEGSNWADFGNL